MYRFALRPRWLAGHALVALAVVVMVNLGFWQLRRLDERRAANALVEARSRRAPALLADLAERPPKEIEYRRALATGTFDGSHEVLVGYRTDDGLPGFDVVTPLVLPDGRAVLVNRGFVPLELADRWPVADAAPPTGEVTVTGLVRTSDHGATPARPVVRTTATPRTNAVDIAKIGRALPPDRRRLLDVQLELQEPVPAGFPDPLPPLELGEGPHLSYAIQWFSFCLIGVGGWLLVLRRHARNGAASYERRGAAAAGGASSAASASSPSSASSTSHAPS
jgi:surfeit locus 1 family protein